MLRMHGSQRSDSVLMRGLNDFHEINPEASRDRDVISLPPNQISSTIRSHSTYEPESKPFEDTGIRWAYNSF